MEVLTENDKIKSVQSVSLESMYTPEPNGRWYPVPHWVLNGKVQRAIVDKGLTITDKRYLISDGRLRVGKTKEINDAPDARMIALYTLGNGYSREEFSHQIAIRNSLDKRWAITMSAAQTVFVCQNGIMTGTKVLGRMNTTYALSQLDGLIDQALNKITFELELNDIRFDKYRTETIGKPTFHDLAMQAAAAGVLPYSKLSKVVDEWNNPTQPEFRQYNNTLWRAFNCFTQVDKYSSIFTKQERLSKLIPLTDAMAGIETVAA